MYLKLFLDNNPSILIIPNIGEGVYTYGTFLYMLIYSTT